MNESIESEDRVSRVNFLSCTLRVVQENVREGLTRQNIKMVQAYVKAYLFLLQAKNRNQ